MLDIFHDLLLFVSIVGAPIILGYLLYLGLHISDHDHPTTGGRSSSKQPPQL
jgi:hypothetical protein